MALSLGKLGYATGNSDDDTTGMSLNTCNGSSNVQVSLSNFQAAYDSITGANIVALGVTETYTTNFTANSQFNSYIKSQPRNYSFSLDNPSYATLTPNSPSAHRCTVYNGTSIGADTVLRCTFNDHFNGSTERNKTITVDA
jgi:hypothetical protein